MAAEGTSRTAEFSGLAESWRRELHRRINLPRWQFFRPRYIWDPEQRKVLERVFQDVLEAERLEDLDLLQEDGRRAVVRLLTTGSPATLRLDGGLRLLDGFDQVLSEYGDVDYLCRRVELAMQQEEGSTTLLTWDQHFGDTFPDAMSKYRAGREPDATEIDSLRNRLSALLHARSDLYAVHKARLRMKQRLLWLVAGVLGALVFGFSVAIAAEPDGVGNQAAAVALAGAIGATVSGAFRLRDTISLGGELREFRPAVLLQPVVGAALALFVLVVMESGLLTTSSASEWAERSVLGFVAGFSEPFALGLVARIADTAGGTQERTEQDRADRRT